MQAPSQSTATKPDARPAAPRAAASAWRVVASVAGAGAYTLLSHWLMVHAADRPWAIAALFGPLLAMVAGVAGRRRHVPTLVSIALLGGLLIAIVARGGLGDVRRLYLAQHAGLHALLAVACLASLRPGRLSWIGQAALRVHGHLTPAMVAYTARVTCIWASYFTAMAALSLAVYAACEWPTWSLLANLVTPAVIVALIVAEQLLRYRLHPEFERSTLADLVRAFSGPAAAAPGAAAPP